MHPTKGMVKVGFLPLSISSIQSKPIVMLLGHQQFIRFHIFDGI